MMKFTRFTRSRTARAIAGCTLLATLAACGNDTPSAPRGPTGFLAGVSGNREIGIVVNTTSRALTMFQLGAPSTTVQIALGTSTTITPVGLSLRGRKAAVPLGNAASVALVNLEARTIDRYFTFPSGNTTGSVWSNDTTIFAANTTTNKVGRIYIGQVAADIATTVTVAPAPTALAYVNGRVLVISGNLANYAPIGNGIVTAINPVTMTVLGIVQTGGTNPTAAAVGPDSLLYVLNTGDYVADANLTIINPATLAIVATIPGMGAGAGAISIDDAGIAYISSFSGATIAWNTKTRAFLRTPANPICAKRASTGLCRGAADAAPSATGKLYQAFFGSNSDGLPPYLFVYSAGTFSLTDSVAVGAGPISVTIKSFQ
jgi:hypothetical protein